jgi:hypothetical protein
MQSLAARVAILGANLDPDAARWIATVGQANVSASRGRLVSDTIRELKAGGVWADLDFLPVLTAENEASALVDWKARKSMSVQTTVVTLPTFTVDRGYAFDGLTNYISTGFVPSTDCVAATGTSFMLGAYERTNVGTASARAMGALTSATRTALLVPRSSTVAQASLNAAAVSIATGLSDSRGLTIGVTDAANGTGYKNGAVGVTTALTTPGSALVNIALFMGAYNNAGTPAAFRASTLAMGMFGRNAWTATQHAQFYAIMQRYMTKLGANV